MKPTWEEIGHVYHETFQPGLQIIPLGDGYSDEWKNIQRSLQEWIIAPIYKDRETRRAVLSLWPSVNRIKLYEDDKEEDTIGANRAIDLPQQPPCYVMFQALVRGLSLYLVVFMRSSSEEKWDADLMFFRCVGAEITARINGFVKDETAPVLIEDITLTVLIGSRHSYES